MKQQTSTTAPHLKPVHLVCSFVSLLHDALIRGFFPDLTLVHYTSGMPHGLSIDKPQWLIDGLWLAAGQLSAGLLESAGGLEPTKTKSS
jgi:hypothetical protein